MGSRFEFYIPSSDAGTRLHGIQWMPDREVKAVLQLSHGMMEYIARYEEFALAMLERGIAVFGHDHLGHGLTAAEGTRGIFSEAGGADRLLEDLHIVTDYGRRQFPGIPLFLLGHSMGSFLGRRYLDLHGGGLSGALFLGTGSQPAFLLWLAGRAVRKAVRRDGRAFRDGGMNRLLNQALNRPFVPGKTSHDWLSRGEEEAAAFEADPLCNFQFSNGAYEDFLEILTGLRKRSGSDGSSRRLPIFLLAGSEDPVGDHGRGVRKVCHLYRRRGFKDITMKLYPGARHELLHEINRKEVYQDIYEWVEERLALRQ